MIKTFRVHKDINGDCATPVVPSLTYQPNKDATNIKEVVVLLVAGAEDLACIGSF